jgi:hypothetical protein
MKIALSYSISKAANGASAQNFCLTGFGILRMEEFSSVQFPGIHPRVEYRLTTEHVRPMFLYGVLRLSASMEEAQRDLRAVWKPNDVWRLFIEQQLSDATTGTRKS